MEKDGEIVDLLAGLIKEDYLGPLKRKRKAERLPT